MSGRMKVIGKSFIKAISRFNIISVTILFAKITGMQQKKKLIIKLNHHFYAHQEQFKVIKFSPSDMSGNISTHII